MFFLVSGKVKSEMIFFSILEVVSASYSVSPAVPFLGDLTMYYRTERSTALEVSDIIESMSTQLKSPQRWNAIIRRTPITFEMPAGISMRTLLETLEAKELHFKVQHLPIFCEDTQCHKSKF